MRCLISKVFQRDIKANNLDDNYIKEILGDISKGRAIPLGSKMYKIRAGKEGQGKRGGFRNIFFWKREQFIIFCLLFGKNEQDNLTPDEKKAFKILSHEYDQLTEDDIKILIKNNTFREIEDDQ
ncbi:MAG: type II toxin-antitoxin system RelE/ParE family toxin [Candidatus Omnitrophota bacterium]